MSETSTQLVSWALILAFTAAGLIQLIRQLPWVDRQMMAAKKPWVCDLCMSWWTSILVTGTWALLDSAPWRAGIPAFAVTLLVTRVLSGPTSDFNIEEIPDLEERP